MCVYRQNIIGIIHICNREGKKQRSTLKDNKIYNSFGFHAEKMKRRKYHVYMCVCVCEREREREREISVRSKLVGRG